MKRVLVTGATGFIGRPLVAALSRAGYGVRALVREPTAFPPGAEILTAPDLRQQSDWRAAMTDIDIVVHLAGIAHAGRGIDEALYDRVNHAATAELAVAAAAAGIGRFNFLSSIRAQTGPSAAHAITETDEPRPSDAYGRSKLAAETAIRNAGVAFTILRPVLVYGPGVKGNLKSLLRLAASPWPLPFGAFGNRRSLLSIDNLIAAIVVAIENPSTVNQTYVVADPHALTLTEIITTLRQALEHPPRLVSVPPRLFEAAFKLIGRTDTWQRLGGELVADPGKLIAAGWRPPVETRAGLAAMARSELPA